jgi:D-aspartate ligase
VVLKFDPNVFHHGALGIVRTLGRLDVPVYGVQEDRWAPVARSRYLREKLPWMDAGAGKQNLPRLLKLGRTLGGRAILIPTDDVGSIFVAEHAQALRECYRFPATTRFWSARSATRSSSTTSAGNTTSRLRRRGFR